MDILLLGVTVVSLIVALVTSFTAWRLMREEKRRSAARIAALSAAAMPDAPSVDIPIAAEPVEKTVAARAPWKSAPFDSRESGVMPDSLSLRIDSTKNVESTKNADSTHATGFLGAVPEQRDSGSRQKKLALAAVMLFAMLAGSTAWVMSAPEGTSAVAVGPNSPLELVSLSHSRQNNKLAVSGLVRNPAAGKPVERLSAVVFLFDRMGTFVTSAKANVDFLKLGAGDESPFVVSIDAPSTVARYRVSFRTDEGVMPHIDRRNDSQTPGPGEQPVNVTLK